MSWPVIRRCSSDALASELGQSTSFERRIVAAPAKVNVRLKVLGRRPDGYHLLSMLNVSTSLADELRVQLRPERGVHLEVPPPAVIPGAPSENLVCRAWHEFWSEFSSDGPPCGIRVEISKKIPIGGGLGGGSSDAGAMLRFLVESFGARIRDLCEVSLAEFEARLILVAARVGADVPYAYRGGMCWVTGIGEEVRPLGAIAPWPGEVLISVPNDSVPTVEFYRYFREQHPVVPEIRDRIMESLMSDSPSAILTDLIENDFESDIVAFRPAVGEALRIAREYYPSTTSLTGSGAAIFSLVPADQEGNIERFERRAAQAGITVHRTRMVPEQR